MKIKRRGNEVRTEAVEVVGTTDVCYRFETMCDYEMTPFMKRTPESAAPELLYKDMMPTLDQPLDEWLQDPTPMPYFFAPQSFTRYESAAVDRKLFKSEKNARIKRYLKEVVRIEFNLSDPVPEGPHSEICRKQITAVDIEIVRGYFAKHPVWSLNLLAVEIPQWSRQKLKYCLPYIAYFYATGPWRNLWLRYGYDPRKDFESRRYQILDIRLNRKAVVNIKSRMEKAKATATTNVKSNVVSQLVYDEEATTTAADEKDPYCPVFAPGKFHHLSWVNMFQYLNIEVPKIQEMLEKVPSPINGARLNEKTGWLPLGFDDQCREIMLDILKKHFQMEFSTLKHEETLDGDQVPADEDYDEDEDDEEEEN